MAGPHFSIVVLARNEARALPRLLGSVEAFADRGGEVLVVDTGSLDDTVGVARAAGATVAAIGPRFDSLLDAPQAAEIERRFAVGDERDLVATGQRLFHFAAARQHAGELAAQRYVLQLDACDEVCAIDVDAIEREIEAGAAAFSYELRFGSASMRVSRFYDRDRFHWEGRVHECLALKADRGPAPARAVSPRELEVRHYKNEEKARAYLAGLALQVLEHPEQPRWWHYLGRELLYAGAHRSAIAVLEAHAAMEETWSAERSQSLCFSGECLERLGARDEASDAYRRAIALDPTRREPLLRLASLCSRHAEFAAAVEHASAALAIPRTSPYPEIEANYTWIPHSILYWALFWLDRREEARAHWEIYRSLVPEEERVKAHERLFATPR